MTAAWANAAIGAAAARILRVAALACSALSSMAGAARADVLEIGANGDVVVISGPAVTRPEAHAPIASPALHSTGAVTARLQHAANAQALSPDLVNAVAWAESRFNDHARSPAGAMGVMQLMPATAASLGVDPADPAQNAQGGAAYLRQMLDAFDGDITLALAAYNAGPQAVRAHGGMPPYGETRAYVDHVLSYMADQAAANASQP
jgi:soluble lytic murein transglycosylase-like protein